MKKYWLYISFAAVALASCKKWVDVQPNDRLLEEQVFNNADNIRSAVNGIYGSLAAPELYGRQLTMRVPDAMAQLYCGELMTDAGAILAASSGKNWRVATTYSYGDGAAKSLYSNIWSSAYRAILGINSFLANLDKYPGVLPPQEEKMLRGEVTALRAFVHFDMLRMFGPVYKLDSVSVSIPYNKNASSKVNPLLPANAVMDSIFADIARAKELLADDPVLTKGLLDQVPPEGDAFWYMRNIRMNIYAVRAFEARALLYRGNRAAAFEAAHSLVEQTRALFPWFRDVAATVEDRCFSSEVIFSLNVPKLYDISSLLYGSAANDNERMAPLPIRLEAIYENNSTSDYRYTGSESFSWWAIPTGGTMSYQTLRKYNRPVGTVGAAAQWRFRMPMLRKSELFYILAETAPTAAEGFGYLDSVRIHRNLNFTPLTNDLAKEIAKEYRKEFYGEGQLFYYYKRTFTRKILKGASIAPADSIAMDIPQYRVPLPEGETIYQ
ncbi:RagB/SusD family nutrient uptake outer membrane protein [Chitinophaga lutea]